jgi:penicillin-binding protein 1A
MAHSLLMDTPHSPRTPAIMRAQPTRTPPRPREWRPAHQPAHARRRPRRPWFRRPTFWLGALLVVLLAAVTVGGAVVYAVATVPLPTELDTSPTVVLDARGKKIGELYAEAAREDVELDRVPEHTRQAVLAAEDAGFYDHPGVSIPGIVRAAIRNVRSGEVRQGGSTISQQYVKTVTGETDQTAMRKAREAVLAMKLEREVSKDQILEWYLNTIYFGRGAYGIQAAARAYFDKNVGKLTVGESALLAGMIPAPSATDPVDNPERATERYTYVIDQMLAQGWIGDQEARALRASQPEVTPRAKRVAGTAPFFMDMVERELSDRVGDQAYRGLTVTTTLNLRMQKAAERVYDRRFDELREDLRATAGEDVKVPTGAMVSLDPDNGAVRALVGGRNYNRDQYNLAIGGPQRLGRQPGSTFKPLALAAWIADGRSPESRFDAPSTITFGPEESGDPDGWEVSNYGGAAYGSMTLREATWSSVNTVYAQVAIEVGAGRIANLGEQAGIASQLEANPSIVLGAEEVTPLDLASAYNTLASGGVARSPRTIAMVERDGEVVFEPRGQRRRVLDRDVAWTTVDVLRGVIDQGTGVAAQIGRPAAGKTGTTQNAADAWFAGFTPDLTTVTWMGYRDSNEAMIGAPTGGGFPAELWGEYMREALEFTGPHDFPEPSDDFEIIGETAPAPTTDAAPAPEDDAPDEPLPAEPAPAPEPSQPPAEPPPPPPEEEAPPDQDLPEEPADPEPPDDQPVQDPDQAQPDGREAPDDDPQR